MRKHYFWILALLVLTALSGCGIPDLPGPIGIPGL